MRNNEEFRSLVYSKRDGLLNEELERKRKFNRRKRFFAVLSSAMAACIVLAVVLPNMPKWINMQEAPYDEEVGGKNDGELPEKSPSHAESNDVQNELAVPMETSPEAMPEESDASAELLPSEDRPSGDGLMEVKFTATLSTEPGGQTSIMTGGVVGRLEGSIGEETLVITDYETLKTTFEGLCSQPYAAFVFGGDDLFREDRMVLVIERTGGDTGDNEVEYSYEKFEDGTLYLKREYTHAPEYEVLCVEVRCVDFVVMNVHGFDLSQITSITVSE